METILQPLGSFAGQIKELFSNCTNITWQQVVMWCLGGLLIFLAIKKYGALSFAAHGVRRNFGQPALFRRNHAVL